jgi:hypothetical protein
VSELRYAVQSVVWSKQLLEWGNQLPLDEFLIQAAGEIGETEILVWYDDLLGWRFTQDKSGCEWDKDPHTAALLIAMAITITLEGE